MKKAEFRFIKNVPDDFATNVHFMVIPITI